MLKLGRFPPVISPRMKKTSQILAALVAATLLVPSSAFAAKGKKTKEDPIMAKYDTDKNGKIDGAEVEAVKKAFEADPKGELAKFDTNADGKLSDEEIAAIAPAPAKKKKNKQ